MALIIGFNLGYLISDVRHKVYSLLIEGTQGSDFLALLSSPLLGQISLPKIADLQYKLTVHHIVLCCELVDVPFCRISVLEASVQVVKSVFDMQRVPYHWSTIIYMPAVPVNGRL